MCDHHITEDCARILHNNRDTPLILPTWGFVKKVSLLRLMEWNGLFLFGWVADKMVEIWAGTGLVWSEDCSTRSPTLCHVLVVSADVPDLELGRHVPPVHLHVLLTLQDPAQKDRQHVNVANLGNGTDMWYQFSLCDTYSAFSCVLHPWLPKVQSTLTWVKIDRGGFYLQPCVGKYSPPPISVDSVRKFVKVVLPAWRYKNN